MSLFLSEINKTQTIKNTRRFLGKDFQNYIAYSGLSRLNLSSPILDPTGVGGSSGVNGIETKSIVNLNAEFAVKAVCDTINSCSSSPRRPYKQILQMKYIKELLDYEIWINLGYEKTNYYTLRSRAYIEFAQRFETWKVRDHATNLPTLIEFKK